MLNEMKTGEEAIRRMAQNDAARGMVAPETKRAAEAAYKNSQNPQALTQSSDDALSDRAIAQNMLTQATRMEAEARGLIAEASRMKKDAERMDPSVIAPTPIPTNVPFTTSAEPAKPKRGRPSNASKVAATNAA